MGILYEHRQSGAFTASCLLPRFFEQLRNSLSFSPTLVATCSVDRKNLSFARFTPDLFIERKLFSRGRLAMDELSKKRWLPLEANPDVMNQFVQGLGLTDEAAFYDVYGFDDELLAMVPTPVLAVLLLFPITVESEAASLVQQQKKAEEGFKVSEKVYFMKQTVGNACGTIGILHAVGNNLSQIELGEGSFLKKYFKSTSTMNPDDRAGYLESASQLEGAHSTAASAGDTTPPDINASVDLHFVCFVCVDGGLYELDGRKPQPIYHGPSKKDTLLKDAVNVIQEFIARNPQSHNFNVIALAKGEP